MDILFIITIIIIIIIFFLISKSNFIYIIKSTRGTKVHMYLQPYKWILEQTNKICKGNIQELLL